MFCPRCDTPLPQGQKRCPNCGYVAEEPREEEKAKEAVYESIRAADAREKKRHKHALIRLILFSIPATAVLILFLIAAYDFAKCDAIIIYAGYALVSVALGIFCAAVLVGLGLRH